MIKEKLNIDNLDNVKRELKEPLKRSIRKNI
jgi:hypothetical protein